MQWVSVVSLLAVCCGSGAVTQAPIPVGIGSGISQFWTDDYKVFDQIYGKTSDKEIYGVNLPPNTGSGLDPEKLHREASEKKERYEYVDDIGEKFKVYNELHKRQTIKNSKKYKQSKSPYGFIQTNHKAITKNNDPETHSYLRHLEQLQKYKEVPETQKYQPNFDVSGLPGTGTANLDFNADLPKLYKGRGGSLEQSEAYRSIQEILDAHEANRQRGRDNQEINDHNQEHAKYLSFGGPPKNPRAYKSKPKAPPPPPPKTKSRCPTGRCRKRATNSYRVFTRPYLRKIKQKIISY